MPRKPSCECGDCPKCERRIKARAAYQALSPEERRAFVARRDPATTRANDRARYERDKEKRRAAMAAYTQTPEGREASNRAKHAYIERNPEKRAAHVQVGNALRRGQLVKGPCARAGKDCHGRIEAHHEDYTRPLEVVWACVRHHDDLDRERQEAEGSSDGKESG